MNDYLEIKKKHLLIFIIVFIFMCVVGGYYIWCVYHPKINIQIGDSSSGNDLIKIEAPKISIVGNGIAEPAASEVLKINNIVMQHEFICQYVRDNYKISDINLDILVTNNQTVLKYYGTVTNLNDVTEDFERIINCDFVLNAEVNHEN